MASWRRGKHSLKCRRASGNEVPGISHTDPGAPMTKRGHLAEIARQTLAILDQGSYTAPGGATVSIRAALARALAETVHYAPEDFVEVVRRRDELLRSWPR